MIKKKQLLKNVLFFKQQFTEHIKMTVKSINIKNRTYYFFNDMINVSNFESNLLKINKKSYKNIDNYCIGHITIKKIDDHGSIYSITTLYLTVNTADGYIEGKNGNKYLTLAPTDQNEDTQNFGMK